MSDDSESERDRKELVELRDQLPAIDLPAASAERIAQQTRRRLGRGRSPKRFVEPILVAVLTASLLVWALLKVLEGLRN